MTFFLADINVWLALAYDAHAHYEQVKRWFEASDHQVFFCRITQIGFLRLLTNTTVMGRDALSQRKAWRTYDQIMQDPRIRFLDEPADLEATFRRLTNSSLASAKQWPDAYLAAMAQAGGMTVVTLDAGLASTPGTQTIHLQG